MKPPAKRNNSTGMKLKGEIRFNLALCMLLLDDFERLYNVVGLNAEKQRIYDDHINNTRNLLNGLMTRYLDLYQNRVERERIRVDIINFQAVITFTNAPRDLNLQTLRYAFLKNTLMNNLCLPAGALPNNRDKLERNRTVAKYLADLKEDNEKYNKIMKVAGELSGSNKIDTKLHYKMYFIYNQLNPNRMRATYRKIMEMVRKCNMELFDQRIDRMTRNNAQNAQQVVHAPHRNVNGLAIPHGEQNRRRAGIVRI
jgi:hypothetical protein